MEDITSLKLNLVTACKILATEGLVDAFGHVSVRIPGTDRFLIPCSISPALVTVNDIIVVNLQGEKVEGEGKPYSETPIHTSVYLARPEVNSVAHTHSLKVITLSVTGQSLKPLSNFHIPFAAGVPVYNRPGLIDNMELGREMANLLGQYKAIMLRGHGAAVTGLDLKEACLNAIHLEQAAEIQIMAMLLGKPQYYSDSELEDLKSWLPATKPTTPLKRAWDFYASRADAL